MNDTTRRQETHSDLPIAQHLEHTDLEIDTILPTQCGLRNYGQVAAMVTFVREDGFFTADKLRSHSAYDSLMSIRRFEDNSLFLHDGHHRMLAIWLAGRNFIRTDEFELTTWQYKDYTASNIEAGFLTPFHPQKEVRRAEFHSFREEAREIAKVSAEEAIAFIEKNRDRYCQHRDCWHIKEIKHE